VWSGAAEFRIFAPAASGLMRCAFGMNVAAMRGRWMFFEASPFETS
jgi:hypothetical protein